LLQQQVHSIFSYVEEICMARKNKQTTISLEINGEQLEKIAEKMAITIGKELAKALAGVSTSTKSSGFSPSGSVEQVGGISIDESIIPVKVETPTASSSKELGEQRNSEDKGLSDSKKKLASLFKNKGE
jgi:hypothetical protein